MRDIIAGSLTGLSAVLSAAVLDTPAIRLFVLSIGLVPLYAIHRAGSPVTTPDTTGAHTGRQRRQPATLQPGHVRTQTQHAGPKRITRCR